MIRKLHEYKLTTNIFIFPYAFDDILGCYAILRNHNFKYVFAGKNTQRIPLI